MKKLPFIYLIVISLIFSLSLPNLVDAATPIYKYEWVAQSGNVSKDGLAHEYTNLQAGQTIDLSLTILNRSGKTVRARHRLALSPDKQVPVGSWGIGTQNPQDGTPSFLDTSSFFLNNNRFIYYEGDDVENNRMMNFSWQIKLKNNLANGTYYLYLRPVCEYEAWTRQVKNGVTFTSGDSDIYWKFIVGGGDSSDVPAGYVRYVNPQYGFSFVYKRADYPVTLYNAEFLNNSTGIRHFTVTRGIIDSGSADVGVDVSLTTDLSRVVNYVEQALVSDDYVYTKDSMTNNGISWVVFKYHETYGNSNVEKRIGQINNGYVITATAFGAQLSQPDQTFLNSVTAVNIKQLSEKMYINNVFGFSFKYPATYDLGDHLLKYKSNSSGPNDYLYLGDGSKYETPEMHMYVNPDGWGPYFPDARYNIALNDNKLVITDRIVYEPDEYTKDGKMFIMASGKLGDNNYSFSFSYKEGGPSYEWIFRDILESFQVI